ncbi:amino acid--tRNA ligase-related protein [Streptomyces scabiei]|uniref:amino acid--tRNA ligase-related protein n=1 Tax=Streptomyces scabiei TaxID=1930 RepID=UPI0018FEDB69|nr:amino acid--tRNA ligase-related protein [Streptomyces scabiei]
MLGPYEALKDGRIRYRGNRVHDGIDDVRKLEVPVSRLQRRVQDLAGDKAFPSIARINHRIFSAAHSYFSDRGALFTLLPLVTRMISSPGAVYGKEAISYTSDTSPVTLSWFDLPDSAFLSESSQIYLELALAQPGVEEVYSVYNSFRLEESDFSHLSEFHHIEFEGRVSQESNLSCATGLISHLLKELLENEEEALAHFLPAGRLTELASLTSPAAYTHLTLREALDLLLEDTGDNRFRDFTTDGTFGSWEEVRLTWICGGPVTVSQYPLLEVPFYHAETEGSHLRTANNADIIWPGYREILGSGERIGGSDELAAKAETFQLPPQDYAPYLETRELDGWRRSSGFGLGWERFLQGVLEMPAIWDVCHFPRTHSTLKP